MEHYQKTLKNKILLVEDNPSMAKLTTIYLNRFGFLVHHVDCGEKAISNLNGNNNIDLVLMDIDLGFGLNGFETAQAIQKISDIPILFHSSHTESEYISKAEKISSCGYVIKDGIDYFLLNQAVRFALSNVNTTKH